MTCTELYQLMANPALLSEKTMPDIKQIVDDFPYFHAARMLYLKNLAVIQDIRQKVELKKMVIHIPDRAKLYLLIESEQPVLRHIMETAEKENFAVPVTPLVAESTLPETGSLEKASQEEPPIYEPASLATVDYTQLIEEDDPMPKTSSPKLQHQELIDSFLLNEQARSRSRMKIEPVKAGSDADEIIQNSDKMEKSLEDGYFTETLAHIYIKQKRYDKALEIIKSLSLKYPKKNIYFADQIRFLEKLIINKNKIK